MDRFLRKRKKKPSKKVTGTDNEASDNNIFIDFDNEEAQ